MSVDKLENAPDSSRKTIAYLRVSTVDQDFDKNKAAILNLANERSLGKVCFIEEIISGNVIPFVDEDTGFGYFICY